MEVIFQFKRACGGILQEVWNGKAFAMQYFKEGQTTNLSVYSPCDLTQSAVCTPWYGMSVADVLASGRDILTDRLLSEGEPSYTRVAPLLPPVEEGAYMFFGGVASISGVELDLTSGVLYSQVYGNQNVPKEPLFDPKTVDTAVGSRKPFVRLLDGRFPIIFSVHADDHEVLEFLYFVEPGDANRDPVVWIREKRYPRQDPSAYTVAYSLVSRSRVIPYHGIPAQTFQDALADTVAYWLRFAAQGAQFELPEKQLERIVAGTQMACAVTFTGDHPHYGHRYYGKEIHDHFPPNFLWALESCCVQNRWPWARRIVQYLFAYALTDEGRFVYRQGNEELFGASACEYAQLLWLLDRYADVLRLDTDYTEQLRGMGDYLLSHMHPCDTIGGQPLIYMCAEADSNTRVHAYINNNLWCVHGLRALASLLERFGEDGTVFRTRAESLYAAVLCLLEKESAQDDRFGILPPFRVGYTAKPATLSACRETFSPMTEEEYAQYARWIDMRNQGDAAQEYTENNYANYRYYPEMLGSMLLPPEHAAGVMSLRENLGGELLCMTRFLSHLDDWPVLHYARFLLENGHIEKYLTLLYAHACHHGIPDLMCYYEQVSPAGKVHAEDCVPSLLTVPIMTAWMFAYERMCDNTLVLLGGIPKAWYAEGFAVKGLGTSFGTVDITADAQNVSVTFSQAPVKPVLLVLRHCGVVQVADGEDYVVSQEGNTLTLKAGIAHIQLTLSK